MSMEDIFSPLTIKNVSFKNRIGVAPMTRMSSKSGSIPRQDIFDFLVRRAERGAGLIFSEAIITDYESSQGYPGQARILNQNQIDAWKPAIEKIKNAGAVAIMQIFHCGRMSWMDVNPAKRIIAPSPIAPRDNNPLTGLPYPIPAQMSRFDIEHVITGFIETTKGAMEAGFDGIEIHGAHGYLINQFLSNYSNKREDEYGGNVENRFRFAKEIINAVRPFVPNDKLLSFRISNWGISDMDVSLFENASEWQDVIKLLTNEPIDVISLSTYDFKDKAFGTNKNMSELTREVTELPLMICGKIYNQKTLIEATKDADIALSAKSILLNPNWVEDAREGKELPLHKSEEANVAYTEQVLL